MKPTRSAATTAKTIVQALNLTGKVLARRIRVGAQDLGSNRIGAQLIIQRVNRRRHREVGGERRRDEDQCRGAHRKSTARNQFAPYGTRRPWCTRVAGAGALTLATRALRRFAGRV